MAQIKKDKTASGPQGDSMNQFKLQLDESGGRNQKSTGLVSSTSLGKKDINLKLDVASIKPGI